MAAEVEEILKRLTTHKGTLGYVIVNQEGIPVKCTLDYHLALHYSYLVTQLVSKARAATRELLQPPDNDLALLRLRSKRHEILVAPDKDYTLIVVQDPQPQ
eukprot:TRINITY_DN6510_c0_g2_i1.p2 TRINITY_DN6510_c0_g2~~TRINITY_DN6510_c0_g2_i1.p2  ORF type:complete len:110 (-),score=18.45 TRINITY_DN6510_c0_g2_i1:259-561(-)